MERLKAPALFGLLLAAGFVPAPLRADAALPKVLMVADFNNAKTQTNLGGNIGAWEKDPSDTSQWCRISFDSATYLGPSGYSLKLDYNINSAKTNYFAPESGANNAPQLNTSVGEQGVHADAYNGLYILMNDQDMSQYRYLSFWLRGDKQAGFTRRFKLELQDPVNRGTYMIDGITDQWQRFSIALDRFSEVVNLKKTHAIVFVFDQNVTRKSGVIYVDDMVLSDRKEPHLYAPSARAPRARFTPFIDGNLYDWKGVPEIALSAPDFLEIGEIDGDKDLSAKGYFQWDLQNLYFAVRVRDNQVTHAPAGKDLYQGDSVELFINPRNDGLIWNNPKDFQIGFAPRGPDDKPQIWAWFQGKDPQSEGVRYAVHMEKDGYTIEAAIPWEFLALPQFEDLRAGAQTLDGAVLQASFAVNDLDLGDGKVHGKLNWYFKKDAKNPDRSTLGTLRLVTK